MKTEVKIILISLLFGLAFWIMQVITDSFIFHGGEIRLNSWLILPVHQIYHRGLELSVFLAFGVIVAWHARKYEKMRVKLQQSEHRYRLIAQNTTDVTATLDNNGNFTYISPAITRLSGYTPEEFHQLGLKEIIAPLSYEAALQAREKLEKYDPTISSDSVGVRAELEHRAKDGSSYWVEDITIPLRDEGGQITGYLATLRDISERRRAELALEQERDRAQLYLDIAAVIIVALDNKGNISLINQKGCQLLGYSEVELLGRNWFSTCLPANIREEVYDVYQHLMYGEVEPVEFYVNHIITRSGVERVIEWHNTVLTDETGRITGVLSSGVDITQQKEAEAALRESEKQHRIISELTSDYIYSAEITPDGETQTGWISGAFTQITGYEPEEILVHPNSWPEKIHPDDRYKIQVLIEALLQNKASVCEYRITAQDGTLRWLKDHTRPLWDPEEKRVVSIVGAVKDITDQKKAEAQLQASVAEKDILLREIHHRVKNNLQVISSLLALQADGVQDHQLRRALLDSRSRVRSMAMVHETLYQSPDLASVQVKAYLEKVARHLFSVYRSSPNRVTLEMAVEPIELRLDTALPCGMITNELVTNALKHAFEEPFSGQRPAVVRVGCEQVQSGQYKLTVSDNGIGLPPEFEWQQASSLGLQLVQILTRQLDGQLEVEGTEGTTFTVLFRQER